MLVVRVGGARRWSGRLGPPSGCSIWFNGGTGHRERRVRLKPSVAAPVRTLGRATAVALGDTEHESETMTINKVGAVMAAEVIPVPTVVEGRWVLLVLVDAHRRVPWLADVTGPEALEELALELRRIEADLPPRLLDMPLGPLTGAYGLAGGITGVPQALSSGPDAENMPLGLQIMRGMLWATCRYCHRAGLPYLSGARAIASALWSAQSSLHSSAARALMPVLEDLGTAASVSDAIATLSALANAKHKALAQASARWLLPRLAEITATAAVGASPAAEPGRTVEAA